jgi:hypothetical protein
MTKDDHLVILVSSWCNVFMLLYDVMNGYFAGPGEGAGKPIEIYPISTSFSSPRPDCFMRSGPPFFNSQMV